MRVARKWLKENISAALFLKKKIDFLLKCFLLASLCSTKAGLSLNHIRQFIFHARPAVVEWLETLWLILFIYLLIYL